MNKKNLKTIDIKNNMENMNLGKDFTHPSQDNELSTSDNKLSELSYSKSSIENEYTIDPITGDKYLKPKGDSIHLGQRAFRLPVIKRDGFEIIWALTRGNEIGNLVAQGWEFVDPKTPGCEEAGKAPYGGTDKEGKAIFHRALQMPKSRYDEMMAKRNALNTAKENEIIFNPASSSGKDFYVGKEHKAPTISRHAGGNDPEMAAAFDKAMR